MAPTVLKTRCARPSEFGVTGFISPFVCRVEPPPAVSINGGSRLSVGRMA